MRMLWKWLLAAALLFSLCLPGFARAQQNSGRIRSKTHSARKHRKLHKHHSSGQSKRYSRRHRTEAM